MKILFYFFFGFYFCFNSPLAFTNSDKKQIVIGSKQFTENIILGEILAQILEDKYDFKVVRKFNMGGTKLLFDSLKQGHIDIYPEYTGTGYTMILKLTKKRSPEKTYLIVKKEFLKKFQLFWSSPLGFENTYILAVRERDSRFKKVFLNSQLKNLSFPFRLALDHEFTERKDGWSLFSKSYRLNLDKNQIFTMNPNLMYSALNSKKVDMIVGNSTDGRMQTYQLRTLKDDKNFFPSYLAAYLTRLDVLESHPLVNQAFQELSQKISEKTMTSLNHQVDQLKFEVTQTARKFLIKKKILTQKSDVLLTSSSQKNSLISYYLSKKNYFFKILLEHLFLVFTALLFALLFALPLSIYAFYNSRVEKILFFIVNTLQTVPSLALLAALIPLLGIGFAPAVTALFIYSLLPLIRNTFEGLKNIDNSYIEVATGIGLTKWQSLKFIQIPLALPVIIAGVRTTVVLLVGTATLAAFVGAGGLGDPIFRGMATLDSRLIFLGAIPSCILAVILDKFIFFLEKVLISKGLQKKRTLKHIVMK
ncbi:MAG: ABC transporter permease subunit [Bdellovibrionales bacterium]|nr:ABC transporter permease subunit [Bdellovibrionales bacterium]